ncbi:MAG: hypothetical protein IJW83_02640 [Clostridia bacterium]|nr:hypothetical protein [Clostridia bacterium]
MTTKILPSEIADIKIASLPTRPTAPTSFGGKGYTASDMKAAFDRLPLFIIERLNALIDDVTELHATVQALAQTSEVTANAEVS